MMTKCETKRWSLASIDMETISREIRDFLDSGEVVALQTLSFGGQFVLIAIFKTDKEV